MSFILDALKKAESERNRASGPVLMDVRIAPPRRHLPAWAWVLGGVLLANLAVLAWLMLRKPVHPAVAATPAPVASTPAAAVNPVAAAPAPPATIAPPATTATTAALPPDTAPPVPVVTAPPTVAAAPDTTGLPTLQDLQAAGVSLPPLLLNLHAYDPAPTQRYVLLNGMRLHEGDFTPEGIKVEAITVDGVVLEASGRRFMLPRN